MAARDFLHEDRAARPAILTLVVGAHLWALLLPLSDKQNTFRDWTRPSSLLFIPLSPREQRLLDAPSAESTSVTVESPPPPILPPLDVDSAPASADLALPDWKQSGTQAAIDVARAGSNYRPLGPRPRTEEPRVEKPRSPFTEPRHKKGETDLDPMGNPIMWVSDKCYLRPRNLYAQPGDPFANIPMTLCRFPLGKLEPRGDLFEHLRKQPPQP